MATVFNSQPIALGTRYRLLDKLGEGGMGAVYRAIDRLTQQTVALKRVTLPERFLKFGSTGKDSDLRLALAQEFKTLASLRHPNIISVLDYGFDPNEQPYYTMELLENAQTLIAAGQALSLDAQVELIVQVLQALVYLHRRGIIHRDLKPDNVQVVEGHVKVLDFGLAISREYLLQDDAGIVGTLDYMAPEVLLGASASEASDLYAVGVMAYELFAGHRLFNSKSGSVISEILSKEVEVDSLEIEPLLKNTLKRLLAKQPADRFSDARELIMAYAEATNQQARYETPALRESFLQAARFVGRKTELNTLSTALADMARGYGSIWLVGGESGVGKSRLLDELRTLALVQGVQVIREQAVHEGGMPYQMWREVLRWLCLEIDLTDLEASVVKSLVPDIGELLGREVATAPELEPQAALTRLLSVIVDLFSRQQQPLLLVAEDLQWVGGENLVVLEHLKHSIEHFNLMIVGSYRNDELAELPDTLSNIQTIKLKPLSSDEINELTQAMLGATDTQPHLINFLQRETEGNVFFLIEVVRILAEEAGQLTEVADMTLPQSVFAGGVSRIVKRRLSRIPPEAFPLLRAAAVAGRQLDLNVLHAVDPTIEVDDWLTTCSNAAVLENQDNRWRFAHDKLREGLLAGLTADEKQSLNRTVAEAIEQAYPDSRVYAAALAYHWANANQVDKEAHYQALAGEQALQSGAYQEAVKYLLRTVALYQQAQATRLDLAYVHRLLGDAYLGLGDLPKARQTLEHGLALLDMPVPVTSSEKRSAILSEVLRQVGHRLLPTRRVSSGDPNYNRLLEIVQIHPRLFTSYYLGNEAAMVVYNSFQTANIAERLGPSPELARSYANIVLIAALIPLHRVARAYARRGLTMANELGDESVLAWVLEASALYNIGVGEWALVEDAIQRGMDICERQGNHRLWGEFGTLRAILFYFRGEFLAGQQSFAAVYNAAVHRNNSLQQAWGMNGQSEAYTRLGQPGTAIPLLHAAIELYKQNADLVSHIVCYGRLGQAYLALKDYPLAREAADKGAGLFPATSPTSFTAMDGYANIAEAYLTYWEMVGLDPALKASTERALQALRRYARVFPVGRPHAHLLQGLYEQLDGRPKPASQHWQRGLAEAKRLGMPYEIALAYYHLGRHFSADDPQRPAHLEQAAQMFETLGTIPMLENARAALANHE